MTDKSKGEPDKANSPALSADWGSLTASPAAPPNADAERASSPKSLRPGEADHRSAPSPTEPGTRADPAAATAPDTAEAGRPQLDAVGARAIKPLAPVDATPRPGRPGSPVLAGAAIAGLLLIAAPFAVSAGVQGVSLDIIPLSDGSLDEDGEQTEDERQTSSEQDTSSDGSGAGYQGGSADQDRADSGGEAPDGGGGEAPDGGGGVNNAPDPGPGYIPEAMEQQAGIPSSSPEDEGGNEGQEAGGSGTAVAAGGGGDSSKGSSGAAGKDSDGGGGGQAGGESEGANGSAGGGIIDDLPDVNTASSDEEEEEEEEEEQQERSGNEAGSNQRSAASDDSEEQGAGTFSALSGESPSAAPSTAPSTAPSAEDERSPASPSPSSEPSPSASPSSSPSASPSASPSGDRYSALAGPGCDADGGAYGQAGAWYPENSTAGWATREGGHDQDGCGGGYDAIPVSGDPEYGDGQFAYWTFSPGYAGAECELYVHIPDDESPLWVGEQEARYQIFPRDKAEGDAVAVFGINQSQVKGGWVQVTGFTSPAEQFTVQLTNIGENPLAGQENTSTHVAASAVRATCS